MKNEPLIIKKRGEDGSRVITVRIKEDILASLDQLAAESNYSRNELISSCPDRSAVERETFLTAPLSKTIVAISPVQAARVPGPKALWRSRVPGV